MTQLGPPVVDARLDGSDGDIEQFGDVGVLELAEIAQEHRLDETLVELLGGVEHVDAGAGDDARRRAAGGEVGRRFEHAAPALQLAVGVDRRVRRQLVHPGRELRATLERVDSPRDGEKGVLGGFLGVERIGEETPAAPEDQWPRRHEQLVEGGAIAGRGLYGRSPRSLRSPRSTSPRFGPVPDAQMIGPYRLERVLGTGSFATVWLAFDDVLDRSVAVKILADNWSRDNDVRRRFLAEARVLLTVESPRIVRGFHIGESPTGQPYLVMAYADRGTVGDRIDQRRREGRTFDARETVGIATEVAYALVDVHASGHLHRDVKPTNVLIRSSSTLRNIPGLAADETVVLGDFGLARGLDLSALTMVAGSPGYVAPEQAAGLTQLDRRADLYPLGRMMLEMLTGDPGGRATTMASAATEQVDVAAMLEAGDGDDPERPTERSSS